MHIPWYLIRMHSTNIIIFSSLFHFPSPSHSRSSSCPPTGALCRLMCCRVKIGHRAFNSESTTFSSSTVRRVAQSLMLYLVLAQCTDTWHTDTHATHTHMHTHTHGHTDTRTTHTYMHTHTQTQTHTQGGRTFKGTNI